MLEYGKELPQPVVIQNEDHVNTTTPRTNLAEVKVSRTTKTSIPTGMTLPRIMVLNPCKDIKGMKNASAGVRA